MKQAFTAREAKLEVLRLFEHGWALAGCVNIIKLVEEDVWNTKVNK